MTLKKLIKRGRAGFLFGVAAPCIMLLASLCFSLFALNAMGMSVALAASESFTPVGVGQQATDTAASSDRTLEQRIAEMESALNKTEERSFDNKMMARELIRYVKLVVVVLVVIALVFPLTIWLMSRKRILGLSSLSPELATTLLVVEERQAKLANILKEIQGEIDYLHTMSVPDLKNLIQQAESYLKQNKADLDEAGRSKSKAETGQK